MGVILTRLDKPKGIYAMRKVQLDFNDDEYAKLKDCAAKDLRSVTGYCFKAIDFYKQACEPKNEPSISIEDKKAATWARLMAIEVWNEVALDPYFATMPAKVRKLLNAQWDFKHKGE